MAGVFELIKRPQRRLVGCHGVIPRADPRALELQAAMEILAEVFKVQLSDVDGMIRSRFETEGSEEDRLWPQEFRLEE
jgi:hypothetical protein